MSLPREVYFHHFTITTDIDGETVSFNRKNYKLIELIPDPAKRSKQIDIMGYHNKFDDKLTKPIPDEQIRGWYKDGERNSNKNLIPELQEEHNF
jgi:hypothetical protein